MWSNLQKIKKGGKGTEGRQGKKRGGKEGRDRGKGGSHLAIVKKSIFSLGLPRSELCFWRA